MKMCSSIDDLIILTILMVDLLLIISALLLGLQDECDLLSAEHIAQLVPEPVIPLTD